MRRALPLLAVLLSLAFAPAPPPRPRPDPGKDDLKKMQGAWAVSRRTLNGRDIAGGGDMTVEIAGDRIRFLVGGERRTEWVVTMDATKTPRVLDRKRVASFGSAAKAHKGKEVVARGIYRLDGDALWLSSASGPGDQARPRDFEGKGSAETLYVLKRLKR
jgi:uncharacterized protein (TIGR03067 family)